MVEVAIDHGHARRLIDQVDVLRHPCDLDLLMFFARHPRILMTSEQLAALTGHSLQQTAESLERLLKSAWLTRTQNPAHAARMYVFATGADAESLSPLLEFASTRNGRLALKGALASRPRREADRLSAPGIGITGGTGRSGSLPHEGAPGTGRRHRTSEPGEEC